ncbi:MAG: glycosyltransferase family A protein, partial [Candidatus Gottesmanbacteria bacterium]
YNNLKSLNLLLLNLYQTKFNNFEVIVVDDASKEDLSILSKTFPIKYIRNERNLGVAQTRMIGARLAQGEIILSLDNDIIPYGDLLNEIDIFFKKNPEALAVSGFAGTAKENTSFYARFKLWRDWVYWNLERDKDSFYWFKTSIGAIKRQTFFELGGYPDYFFKPGSNTLEDLDFSYRLAQKGKIYFDSKMAVGHRYGGLSKLVTLYFKRTTLFIDYLFHKHRFPGVATTQSEAATIILGAISLFFLVGILINQMNLLIFIAIFLIFIFRQKKFLVFCLKKEGTWFMIKAFLTNWFLYSIIIIGAVFGGLEIILNKLTNNLR